MFFWCLYLAGVFLKTVLPYFGILSPEPPELPVCSPVKSRMARSQGNHETKEIMEKYNSALLGAACSWSCLVGDLVATTTLVDHHFSRFFTTIWGNMCSSLFFQISKSRKYRGTEACLVYVFFFFSGARNSILQSKFGILIFRICHQMNS